MSLDSKRRHVFISHHHADDAAVTDLTSLLARKGYDIRNSSIRAKPANQRRLKEGLVSEKVIRRLLRMKISWAGAVVVLIGKETYSRPWVNWEIQEANRQNKKIIGVYERGGTEADIPPALETYSTGIYAWNAEAIIAAIDGIADPQFQKPDGTARGPTHARIAVRC